MKKSHPFWAFGHLMCVLGLITSLAALYMAAYTKDLGYIELCMYLVGYCMATAFFFSIYASVADIKQIVKLENELQIKIGKL